MKITECADVSYWCTALASVKPITISSEKTQKSIGDETLSKSHGMIIPWQQLHSSGFIVILKKKKKTNCFHTSDLKLTGAAAIFTKSLG